MSYKESNEDLDLISTFIDSLNECQLICLWQYVTHPTYVGMMSHKLKQVMPEEPEGWAMEDFGCVTNLIASLNTDELIKLWLSVNKPEYLLMISDELTKRVGCELDEKMGPKIEWFKKEHPEFFIQAAVG